MVAVDPLVPLKLAAFGEINPPPPSATVFLPLSLLLSPALPLISHCLEELFSVLVQFVDLCCGEIPSKGSFLPLSWISSFLDVNLTEPGVVKKIS